MSSFFGKHCEDCLKPSKSFKRCFECNEKYKASQRRITCKFCDVAPMSYTEWVGHVTNVHHDQKIYKCRSCDAAPMSKVDLEKHDEQVHPGQLKISILKLV
jgi:hypothetical protein